MIRLPVGPLRQSTASVAISASFFLSWAQAWREKARPEKLRDLILTDVHSPASARINGPFPNMDNWYAAWKVGPSSKLYVAPDARVHLW